MALPKSSRCSIQSSQTSGLARTLQVQDQIIEQLRADQHALREALEAERSTVRDLTINHDRELKTLQRQSIQDNKTIKTQELKIEELERQLSAVKETLESEEKSLKCLEKEHVSAMKELKLKHSKDFDKANRQEVIIDQQKSEIEELKELLESERSATSILIREHASEVKFLREELKSKSCEAYRELKERATRERDEYREMQAEAEKTYSVLEKDFRESLLAKDEEIKRIKTEAKATQRELEEQLRASVKEPKPIVTKSDASGSFDQMRRLKNEVAVLRQQNRKLLNQLQEMEARGLKLKESQQELAKQDKQFRQETQKLLDEIKAKDRKISNLERQILNLNETLVKQKQMNEEEIEILRGQSKQRKSEPSNKKVTRSLLLKMTQPREEKVSKPIERSLHVKDIVKKLQEKEKHELQNRGISVRRGFTKNNNITKQFRKPLSVMQEHSERTSRTIEDLRAIDEDIEKLRNQIEERDKIILALREAAEAKDTKMETLLLRFRKDHTCSPVSLEPVLESNEESGGSDTSFPASPSPPLCKGGLCWADDFANKEYHEPVYAQLLNDHRALRKSYLELQQKYEEKISDLTNQTEFNNNIKNKIRLPGVDLSSDKVATELSIDENQNISRVIDNSIDESPITPDSEEKTVSQNAINLVMAEQIRILKEKESSLLQETQDLREQNELLEFRILELEECQGNDLMKRPKSFERKDIWSEKDTCEDISDSGVMSLPTSDDLTSDSEFGFTETEPNPETLKLKLMDVIRKSLTSEESIIFNRLIKFFEDCESKIEHFHVLGNEPFTAIQDPDKICVCKIPKIYSSNLNENIRVNRITGIATVFPNADNSFEEFNQTDLKAKKQLRNAENLQESGIFEGSELSNEESLHESQTETLQLESNYLLEKVKITKSTQTEPLLDGAFWDLIENSTEKSPNKRFNVPDLFNGSGDLSIEILKLSEIQKRIQQKGYCDNDSFFIGNNKILEFPCGHTKHISFYEERLKQIEDKLSIYESSGDTKEKLLRERLEREVSLARQVKELKERISHLESKNQKLEEEKCEFEEADNDARFQCQRLEIKLQELIERKTELQLEVQRLKYNMAEEKKKKKTRVGNLEGLVDRYEQRNYELEEKDIETRQRMNVMEAAMPAILAWNMFRICQTQNVTSTAAVEQVLGLGSLPGKANDTQIFNKLEELIEDQKKLRTEYEKAEEEAEGRENALKEKILELEEKSAKDREMLEAMTSSMRAGVTPKASEMNEDDNDSLGSIHSNDLVVFEELQRLAENEVKMRRRIEELERKEQAYMATLQQADEIWAGMEEEYKQRILEAEKAEAEMQDRIDQLEKTQSELQRSLVEAIPEENPEGAVGKEAEDEYLGEATEELTEKEAELRTRINELEGDKTRLEEELAAALRGEGPPDPELTKRMQGLEEENLVLKDEVDSFRNQVKNLKEQLGIDANDMQVARRSQMNNAVLQEGAVSKRLGDLEDKGKSLANLELTLHIQITDLTQELAKKEKELNGLEVTIWELREEVETLEKKVSELETTAQDGKGMIEGTADKPAAEVCDELQKMDDISQPIAEQVAKDGVEEVTKRLSQRLDHVTTCEVCNKTQEQMIPALQAITEQFKALAELLQSPEFLQHAQTDLRI